MASKNKYRADASWVDITKYLRELEVEYGLRIEIVLPTPALNDSLIAVEVRFYDAKVSLSGPGGPIHAWRGSFPTRGEGALSALMYVVSGAWSSYLDNPWVWSETHRRKAVQAAE
jgi:hypothetical protein